MLNPDPGYCTEEIVMRTSPKGATGEIEIDLMVTWRRDYLPRAQITFSYLVKAT
jgi:hypothetical protein